MEIADDKKKKPRKGSNDGRKNALEKTGGERMRNTEAETTKPMTGEEADTDPDDTDAIKTQSA